MKGFLSILIVNGSLVVSGSAWADPPQARGRGHAKAGKVDAKEDKTDRKDDTKDDKRDEKTIAVQPFRYSNLDLNHDSIISRAEWRGDDASFRAQDWNRDGVLSGDELRLNATRPDRFFRKDWKGDLREFDRADTNHDGVLTAAEFAAWR